MLLLSPGYSVCRVLRWAAELPSSGFILSPGSAPLIYLHYPNSQICGNKENNCENEKSFKMSEFFVSNKVWVWMFYVSYHAYRNLILWEDQSTSLMFFIKLIWTGNKNKAAVVNKLFLKNFIMFFLKHSNSELHLKLVFTCSCHNLTSTRHTGGKLSEGSGCLLLRLSVLQSIMLPFSLPFSHFSLISTHGKSRVCLCLPALPLIHKKQ